MVCGATTSVTVWRSTCEPTPSSSKRAVCPRWWTVCRNWLVENVPLHLLHSSSRSPRQAIDYRHSDARSLEAAREQDLDPGRLQLPQRREQTPGHAAEVSD